MPFYILSPRAQADLNEIWDYTVMHWDSGQAELYIRQIQVSVESLARDPAKGRSCEDVRAGYYKYAVGSHVIFYRRTKFGIDVVRILHQRMDFIRQL